MEGSYQVYWGSELLLAAFLSILVLVIVVVRVPLCLYIQVYNFIHGGTGYEPSEAFIVVHLDQLHFGRQTQLVRNVLRGEHIRKSCPQPLIGIRHQHPVHYS